MVLDLMSLVERGPNKRRIKPAANTDLINFYSESSSDSDFRIEDHYVNSESDSGDSNFSFTDDYGNQEKAKKDDEDGIRYNNGNIITDSTSVETHNQDNSTKVNFKEMVDKLRVCSICLSDASDDVNELIDCDECGISVHEGCYGVHDSKSVSSSVSSCSTEPWFCEPCKAGIENPTCELCPNFGGIFKETDNGHWVHLVCALYIPGVIFGEVKSLSKIKLFKNASPQWGKKSCTFCKDSKFSSSGVTISCDAGMCRTNFHVTCAQQEGVLSEATSPETDPNDPFYGHCKLHADKLLVKKKKRNFEILQLRTKQMQLKREQQSSEKSATWQRNQRCLKKLRSKYEQMKKNSKTPKTESTFKSKIPRSIITSAPSCRALWSNASLMGLNSTSQEVIKGQIKELRDVPKKWNVPPAFSLEFVSYFTDRNLRLADSKNQLKHFTDKNKKLHDKQKIVQEKYTQDLINNEIQKKKHLKLENIIKAYYNVIKVCNPNANISDVDVLTSEVQNSQNSFKNVAPLGLHQKCGICSHTNDQHLLAKCDTCCLYYHLRCLSPPLTKLPQKMKLSRWQCNECEKSNPNSGPQTVDPYAPIKSKNVGKKAFLPDSHRSSSFVNNNLNCSEGHYKKAGTSKEIKHEQHRDRYSSEIKTEQVKSHKRILKRPRDNSTSESESSNNTNSEPLKHAIKLYSTSNGSGSKTTSSQLLGSPASAETPQICKKTNPKKIIKPMKNINLTFKCHICKINGTTKTMVQCMECSNYYHFCCLDPPLKKTPVTCGYSWICEECDQTDSDC